MQARGAQSGCCLLYTSLNLESVGINLPYNMQAEQSVLGAVLLKPDTLTDLVEIRCV